jgi:hypothetical protein
MGTDGVCSLLFCAAKRSSYKLRATHIPEPCSTRTWGWICWIRSLSGVAETWWDAGGIFACPDTDSFSARCQNREEDYPLAIHTSEFVRVLVLLATGLALCYGESNNLTWPAGARLFVITGEAVMLPAVLARPQS